jgi:hypothetical protein
MSEIKINLNQTARVKFTPRGIFLYQDMMMAWNRRLPPTAKPFEVDPPLDEDGYYRAELWRIMSEFGAAMSMDSTPPFDLTIFVEEPS